MPSRTAPRPALAFSSLSGSASERLLLNLLPPKGCKDFLTRGRFKACQCILSARPMHYRRAATCRINREGKMLMVFMRYALGGFMIPLLALALLVLATDGPVQTM